MSYPPSPHCGYGPADMRNFISAAITEIWIVAEMSISFAIQGSSSSGPCIRRFSLCWVQNGLRFTSAAL